MSAQTEAKYESLLTPAEVASAFGVDVKTVTRWADSGRLTCTRTLGGHRRFFDNEVQKLLLGNLVPRQGE